MEQRHHLENEAGTRESIIWEFDGIRMGHAISKFHELTSFNATSPNTDLVRLHIGLKGNYSFHYQQLDTDFHLIGGHHNIMYSKDFDMTVENHTLELETFGVSFPKETFLGFTQNANDLLKSFGEHIVNGKSILLSDQWGAVDPQIQQVIYQIINNKYNGDLQRLFLLSKSIELLVLCAESALLTLNKSPETIKTKEDKEKIIAVRDLINDRLSDPPSLTQIARTVGLNEYKLKRGFKETFNTTVFGYLTEQRLLLAQQYLLDTQKTAAEISFELGYSTPQHFNNVFKKRFGQTPDSVRNR
ncbi:MAG: helix-turn-helix transcriptional regulator [Bacteroidetes bacterium]|nr:helix-turn-helix transcriptional regulator [Bacteroidota bacterium]